ncbi:hypothetical protein [Sorangium sp. So ce861]|uniref:hypothetical protein n=1 Tax=Sorangium sp. So ce861 TaxID=3133323 RepID=UPI003F6351BF
MSYEDIIRRLRQGEGLADIARSLIPHEERDALRRAALVRWFDEELWTTTLGKVPGREDLPFERLLKNEAIEAVPRKPGVYRVKTRARAEHLRSWFPSGPPAAGTALPEEIVAIERALLAYFVVRGGAMRDDLLYHAALVAPNEARALFKTLYDEADRDFDLARCWDLLRLLLEGQTLGVEGVEHVLPNSELVALHADRRIYLDVRSHFDDEYYQSGRFLERPALKAAFEALLTREDGWILQLFARGGMGKTMALRWFIARVCVPSPRRIPCARIDFDHDLDVASSPGGQPWRLAAKFAEHLHRQIAGTAFSTLAREASEYQRTAERRSEADRAAFAAEITDRFTSALCEARLDKPVILILDTLEEALFHRQEQLSKALDYLAELHAACPMIRIVLASRYDLGENAEGDGGPRERLPGFQSRFGAVTTTLPVEPFLPEEARRYFVEIRGIPQSEAVEAAIERAEGLPFKVALLADTLQQEPELGAQEIRDYPSVDLVYLIERVVKRLSDPQLQWLLRYGAVPSRLTFPFLRDVMVSFLPAAMAGIATYDDPTQGLPERVRNENVFPQGPEVRLPDAPDETTLRKLWGRLARFAGGSSWVSYDSKRDELTFHADVVNPMRRLLRQHDVFRMLHEAALKHFQHLAESDREHQTEWTIEAVYHAFQLLGEAAGGYFRSCIDRAKAEDDAKPRYALARRLVSSIYIDEAGQPQPLREDQKDVKIISRATQAEAEYERAAACLDLARAAGDPASPYWNEAKGALDVAERIRKELGLDPQLRPSPTEIAVARVKILRNERKLGQALAVLNVVAQAVSGSRDRFLRESEYAAVLGEMGQAGAVDHAVKAVALAKEGVALAPWEVLRVLEDLARLQVVFDRHDAAVATCEEAIACANRDAPARVPGWCCLQIDILLRQGRAARALKLLDREETASWPRAEAIERAHLRARAFLLLGDLARALEPVRWALEQVAGELETSERTGLDPRRVRELRASGHELEGMIFAASLDVDGAMRSLSRARSEWYSWSGPSGDENGARCLRRCVEISLQLADDAQDAEAMLREAEKLPLGDGSEAAVHFAILYAELSRRRGDSNAAQERLSRAEAQLGSTRPPHLLARLALEGLSSADVSFRQRWGDLLVNALGRMESARARLELTDALARCPTGALGTFRPELFALLVLDDSDRESGMRPGELARYLLRRAELLRVLGDGQGSLQMVEQARSHVNEAGSPVLLRDVFLAFDRLEPEIPAAPFSAHSFFNEARPFAPFAGNPASPGFLAGVLALEHAERLARIAHPAAMEVAAEAEQHLTSALPAWRTRSRVLREKLARETAAHAVPLPSSRPGLALPEAIPRATPVGISPPILQGIPPAIAQATGAEGEIRVRVRLLDPTQMLMEQLAPQQRSWTLKTRKHSLLREAVESGFTRTSEVVSYGLVKMLSAEPRRVVDEMGRILFDQLAVEMLQLAKSTTEPLAFHLEIDGGSLAAIPWELGVLVFDLAETGSPLAGRLRIYRRPENPERAFFTDYRSESRQPVVAILQPSAAVEERSRREAYYGKSIPALYRSTGLEVRIFEDPSFDDVVEMAALEPALVHVRTGFKEASTQGGVQLDFSGSGAARRTDWAEMRESEAILPSMLARMLRGMKTNPTLILDTYRPAGETEIFRQLLLRNSFAAVLHQLHVSTSVVATGLFPADAQEIAYDTLLRALATGDTLGDSRATVLRMLRDQAYEALSMDPYGRGDIAAFAIGLFSSTPNHRPLPLR